MLNEKFKCLEGWVLGSPQLASKLSTSCILFLWYNLYNILNMNKKIVSLIIFISLSCLASFALAQSIPNPLGTTDTVPKLLLNIANAVGELIATLGSIMIIVAGILYLTSAGNPERVGTAKKALVYAIAGIVIGIAASSIVNIVLNIMNPAVTPPHP